MKFLLAKLTVGLVIAGSVSPLLTGCKPARPLTVPRPGETPTEIWGVSALQISSKNITVTKATSGAGRGMMLLIDGRVVAKATVSIGDAFMLSDGHHASNRYRVIDIDRGWAVFDVNERFNAVSFGGGIRDVRRTLRFAAYSRD